MTLSSVRLRDVAMASNSRSTLAPSAAAAIYARFLTRLPAAADPNAAVVNPAAVLALSAADLRAIGVSARKAAYLHDLAGRFAAGELSESAVAATDEAAPAPR
ncbi:hypothetical protein OsI_00134 [Oryza sativa Indica Group]|uniref:Uncharacterized protein n=1 Tax=Oryza sativa subsp. indica TaxID=39946 RepID=B8ACX3_ORYSI|nr:hypothetical protein OsI_00134 [Oryza sativa Indica Group]